MSVQEHAGNDRSCVWYASDFSDGELKNELFSIRFGSVGNCKTFRETVREVAESQQNKEENKDASAAAGLLKNLTVEDNGTIDKAKEDESVASKEEKETKSEPEKTDAEKEGNEPPSN